MQIEYAHSQKNASHLPCHETTRGCFHDINVINHEKWKQWIQKLESLWQNRNKDNYQEDGKGHLDGTVS